MTTLRSAAAPAEPLFPLESAPGRRLWGLDALRGMAIFLITCGHLQFRMPETAFGAGFWTHARQVAVAGVDLFLVLSGFLIGGMFLSEFRATGRVAFGRFFARRAWRLGPVYLLAILFGWQWFHRVRIIDEGIVVKGTSLWGMWPYFAMVPNYYNIIKHDYGAAAILQAWTLAVIVHFYVIFALLMAGIIAMGRRLGNDRVVRVIPWLVGLATVGCLLARWHNAPAATYKYEPYHNYFETHLRLDELMFGVLLAYWAIYFRPQLDRAVRALWLPITIACVVGFAVIACRKDEAPRWLVIVGFPMAGLASAGLILVTWWWELWLRQRLANDEPSLLGRIALLPIRGAAWVGIWSYAIFFSHQPLVEHWSIKARDLIGRHHLLAWDSPYLFTTAMLAYVAMAIAVGAAVYFAVEWPMLILRECLVGPQRRGGTSSASSSTTSISPSSATYPFVTTTP